MRGIVGHVNTENEESTNVHVARNTSQVKEKDKARDNTTSWSNLQSSKYLLHVTISACGQYTKLGGTG